MLELQLERGEAHHSDWHGEAKCVVVLRPTAKKTTSCGGFWRNQAATAGRLGPLGHGEASVALNWAAMEWRRRIVSASAR